MNETLNPNSPGSASVTAPAKLNLFLEVLGKRPDGYHDLETVMVAIDWADRLTFRREGESGVRLTCSDPSLPTDERNLVVRAARRILTDASNVGGVCAVLQKEVPAGAGMGGGSSDAAATLRALNGLLSLGRLPADLSALAAEIGSDVPFFLGGNAAVCRGRGERVEPFGMTRPWTFVVVKPEFGLATAEVYRTLQIRPGDIRTGGSAVVAECLQNGDVNGLAEALFNRLEEPAFRLAPAVAEIRHGLTEAGAAAAMMTGSGSAVFGLCRDQGHAEQVLRRYGTRPGQKARIVHALPD